MKIGSIILAAGKGTRMNSNCPKVMNCILGKPLLSYVVDTSVYVTKNKPIVVIGYKSEKIKKYFGDKINYAEQKKQLGTGDAVKCCVNDIKNFEAVFIFCGDVPFITNKTLNEMIKKYIKFNSKACILTAKTKNNSGYGRILKDSKNNFIKIIEEKDASKKEKKITEINSGIYLIDKNILIEVLKKIKKNNIKNEYYLTDIFEHIVKKNKIITYCIKNNNEIMGINDKNNLIKAIKYMKEKINNYWIKKGVFIKNPDSVYIGSDVKIKKDVTIDFNVNLEGNTIIKDGVYIGPNSTIKNSIIGKETEVNYSIIFDSVVGKNCKIGPFAFLRPENIVKDNVKIGDFVELKKTKVDKNSKIPHHSYIGNAFIGKNVNIGAGSITCNYDGNKKFNTIIKDNVFVGSNSNLIAPLLIENNSYIGAGSTIVKNVPKNSLAIERNIQKNIKNWKKKEK